MMCANNCNYSRTDGDRGETWPGPISLIRPPFRQVTRMKGWTKSRISSTPKPQFPTRTPSLGMWWRSTATSTQSLNCYAECTRLLANLAASRTTEFHAINSGWESYRARSTKNLAGGLAKEEIANALGRHLQHRQKLISP